jgi:uncharacterized protein YodC (DUF2158 family)
MPTIKPGDVVRLKSGGPLMTVEKIVGDSAKCDWFDGNKPMGAIFPMSSLEIDDTPDSLDPDS